MNFKVFKNIYFENIALLFKLAKETPNNILSIKNNYNLKKQNLMENLNFLLKINFFIIKDNSIKIAIEDEDEIEKNLISLILKNPEYSACLKSYLMNFKNLDSKNPKFNPTRSYNYETSDLRDFLITLGYLKNNGREFELLAPEILEKFIKFKLHPDELEKKLIDQKNLGLKAEKLILSYEKNFLNESKINKEPIHISQEDVSAGYDILSYRKVDKLEEIFIEVKAVSVSNYQFHLSNSEYQTAIKHNPNYFIYLLPVDYSLQEGFDIKKLLKINNLKENIFENRIAWNISEDGFLISKNSI